MIVDGCLDVTYNMQSMQSMQQAMKKKIKIEPNTTLREYHFEAKILLRTISKMIIISNFIFSYFFQTILTTKLALVV